MIKTDKDGIRSKATDMDIQELILKGIDISKSPGVAVFGIDGSKVKMYYGNEAFRSIYGLETRECEACATTFLKRLKFEHGRDVIFGAREGLFKEGETRHYEFSYYNNENEAVVSNMELTFLEKEKGELIFYCTMTRQEDEKKIRLRDPKKSRLHMELEDGKIELFLQPKFSLTTRSVIGAEGLSRWILADGRVIMPSHFIPQMEKDGGIIELDFYIYEQVLRSMKKWEQSGLKLLPVSVNFSRAHIRNEEFVSRIIALAKKYEIDNEYIEIEITESVVSDNDQKMLKDLSALRDAGFKVDIDDFGTGYSSLNMLLTAPVDTVKVDKSFIDGITKSEKSRKYIDRLASLIKVADKDVIFEGVETEHQAEILKDCGYTKAQGFLFGEAVPVTEFARKYLKPQRKWAPCAT